MASGTYSPAQLKASMEQPAKGHFVQHRTPPVVGLARFPSSWGEPPSIQTADFRPLPGGYGYGSTTLSKWIAAKMAADAQAGTMEYPPSWGKPPTAQTRDIRPLPMGYGTVRAKGVRATRRVRWPSAANAFPLLPCALQGSSTLGAWILERAHSAGHGHGPDLDKLNPDSHPARPLGSRARYGDLRSAHDRVRNQ